MSCENCSRTEGRTGRSLLWGPISTSCIDTSLLYPVLHFFHIYNVPALLFHTKTHPRSCRKYLYLGRSSLSPFFVVRGFRLVQFASIVGAATEGAAEGSWTRAVVYSWGWGVSVAFSRGFWMMLGGIMLRARVRTFLGGSFCWIHRSWRCVSVSGFGDFHRSEKSQEDVDLAGGVGVGGAAPVVAAVPKAAASKRHRCSASNEYHIAKPWKLPKTEIDKRPHFFWSVGTNSPPIVSDIGSPWKSSI